MTRDQWVDLFDEILPAAHAGQGVSQYRAMCQIVCGEFLHAKQQEYEQANPVPSTGTGSPSARYIEVSSADSFTLRNSALYWAAEHPNDPNAQRIREAVRRVMEAERRAEGEPR